MTSAGLVIYPPFIYATLLQSRSPYTALARASLVLAMNDNIFLCAVGAPTLLRYFVQPEARLMLRIIGCIHSIW